MDKFAVGLANWVLQSKAKVVLILSACVLFAGFGTQFLTFDTNYRAFFSEDNPQYKAFDALQRTYTKTDNVLFIVKPKQGTVFNRQPLEAIKKLTEESWKLPFATRVDSLTNYQHTYAEGDNLIVTDLVDVDPSTMSEEFLQSVETIALEEPLLVNRVVSGDGTATGVNVTFQFPEKSVTEVPTTASAANVLLKQVQDAYPELTIKASGIVMMNNAFSTISQQELQELIPIMYAVLIIGLILFLRSITGTIATLIVIALSAVVAMGLAGWFGVKLTPPSATAPTIILTLAIADSVHIITSMFKEMALGRSKQEAIIESIRINLQPVFLTSITTAIGFLSLNYSEVPPFHDLGNMTAVGVIAAFFFSMLLLPILLSVIPLRIKTRKQSNFIIARVSALVTQYPKRILSASIVTAAIIMMMIPLNQTNDQFVEYFEEDFPFRESTEFMIDNLTGIYQIEYSIPAASPHGVSNPHYLKVLDRFAVWLRQQKEVMHVYSITDILKRLNKNMHGDDTAYYRIPDDKAMAAQYLLLYEMSLPYGLDLNDRLNIDKSATRLTATLHNLSSNDVRAFKTRSERWLKTNAPGYMQTEGTSPIVMFSYISQRNIESMIDGNLMALLLISICIMLVLRSFSIGVISLIPNFIPILVAFGLWGVAVGEVNMAVAVVAAISLGIIVDDTVHFLSKYNRARTQKKLDVVASVEYAFSMVGSALLITTIVLVAGFAVLFFSGFEVNRNMGLLTATTISCALIFDFLLLPALLIWLGKKNEGKGKDSVNAELLSENNFP